MLELLTTDPAAIRIRPTNDVDIVANVMSRAAFDRLQQQLTGLGFTPDTRPGAPLCRMWTRDGLVLDVMPLDERVLGFANKWYALALDTAVWITLEPDLHIRCITAPTFLVTKWEAYRQRGAHDPFTSSDLEDIVTLVASRPEIVSEIAGLPPDARDFVATSTRDFLGESWAEDVVEGSQPDARQLSGMIDVVMERMRIIAGQRPDV